MMVILCEKPLKDIREFAYTDMKQCSFTGYGYLKYFLGAFESIFLLSLSFYDAGNNICGYLCTNCILIVYTYVRLKSSKANVEKICVFDNI